MEVHWWSVARDEADLLVVLLAGLYLNGYQIYAAVCGFPCSLQQTHFVCLSEHGQMLPTLILTNSKYVIHELE